MDAGADINIMNDRGHAALHYCKNKECKDLLLAKKVEISAESNGEPRKVYDSDTESNYCFPELNLPYYCPKGTHLYNYCVITIVLKMKVNVIWIDNY